ncbi:MAG: TIGR03564 family F420-dependent LLM class oxidoreductase [Myxococcota bacterium]|nr:TIGR03564 family F420-dependent LLM class oxidoreductase [Myxococcota bacterium]
MRIGWNGGGHHHSLESIRADARRAAEEGFSSFWLSQIMGPDSLTALAAIAADAPGIELGTSIVPLYGRHPLALAQQALTVQAATGGRLVLGIGPSHKPLVEGMFGESYARPFTRTKEMLAAISGLVRGEPVSVEGEELTARGQLAIEAPAPRILIAALGPKMLDLAGREADGTTLWMVGAKTISSHIAPRIREAACAAGRPAPRILAGVPVCVTDDVGRARAHAAEALKMYGALPAYRAMLDREGIGGPEDLVAAGSEDAVREQLAAFAEAGATDLRVGAQAPTEAETERTQALLATLAKESDS